MTSGSYKGHLQVDLVKEAIEWWRTQLDEIETCTSDGRRELSQ
jgi:hypothetical protein